MNLGGTGTIRLNRRGFCVVLVCLVILGFYLLSNKRSEVEAASENNSEDNLVSIQEILRYAITAAQLGGNEVVSSKDSLKIQSKGKTYEGANDSVTTADFKSHCVMTKVLQDKFSYLKIISEEKTNCEQITLADIPLIDLPQLSDEKLSSKGLTLWIDPLDATQEYTEKLYQYVTTMVCLSYKGRPIFGVIHNPFQNVTTWAWVNKVHSNNLEPVKPMLSENSPRKIIISRSHAGEVKDTLINALGTQTVVESAGGAGYKVLEVAQGRANAYIHTTAIKKWDICAGDAILTALNGRMSTLSNDVIDYSNGDKVVNDKGIIAALNGHDWYARKLRFR